MPLDVTDRTAVEREFTTITEATKTLRERGDLHDGKIRELALGLENVQRTMLESNKRAEVGTVGNDERDMVRRYTKADGSVRMVSERVRKTFAGHTVDVDEPGLLDDSNRASPAQADLQTAISRRSLARLLMPKGSHTPLLDAAVARAVARLPKPVAEATEKAMEQRQFFAPVGKRSFNDSANEGAEWIQDGFIPDLYRAFEYPRGIASLFQDIQVSTDTWSRPKITTGARPYLLAKITDDNPASYTPSSPVTDSSSMTVPGLAVRILADAISVEDSAIAAIPALQSELQRAYDDGYEDALINGDTAGTHQDTIATWNIRSRWGATGLGGSADHRRAFIGARARAYDVSNTTDQSAAQTAAGHLADLATLGERAMGDIITIVSPEYMVAKIMGWSETITMEKFGAMATMLRGAPVALFGQPVFMSRFLSADLATTGLYTGSGAYSGKLILDRAAFANYTRRAALIEIEKEIKSQHFELVLTGRRLWATPDAASTKNVHFAFKLL